MKLVKAENINNILFLDIETAPSWEHLKDAPANVQKEWIYKFKYNEKAPQKPDPEKNVNHGDKYFEEKYFKFFSDLWLKQAGLYAEFSRIVCISMGFVYEGDLRITSASRENEEDLLDDFVEILGNFKAKNRFAKLCAHYGKGFDYPYIAKRLLIHRRPIPFMLDTYGVKPWDMVNLLDTHEFWKMGGFGSGGTLSSIAMAFGIPSPKNDIEGADVSRCYHNGEIDRIVLYCEKDVLTTVNVFKAMRGEEILTEEQVTKI